METKCIFMYNNRVKRHTVGENIDKTNIFLEKVVCIFTTKIHLKAEGKKLFFHFGFIRTTRVFVSPIKTHPGPFVMSEKLLIPLLNCAIWKNLDKSNIIY